MYSCRECCTKCGIRKLFWHIEKFLCVPSVSHIAYSRCETTTCEISFIQYPLLPFIYLSFFVSSSCIYPPPIQDLHPQGLTTQIPVGQMPLGGTIFHGPEHQTDTQGQASLNVWSVQCQGLRRRQHRIEHKVNTLNPRIVIKIPDLAANRTRAGGLEGRDSTDHATETDLIKSNILMERPAS